MDVRQRKSPSRVTVAYGGPETLLKKNITPSLSNVVGSLVKRRNAIYTLPLILFVYVFGPFLPHAPKAIYVYISSGFAFDLFVGPGIRDMVEDMVVDDQRIFNTDFKTDLPEKRQIFLKEFLHYRDTHPLPIISELDPEEEGHLDTEGVWKTLFVRSGGHDTCAAKYFPETIKAVDQTQFKVLSIMFSRLAPGQVIPPHTGYTKLIQLYHMGLKVPQTEPKPHLDAWACDGCPKETMIWEEGKEFVFDDSFVHAAENPNHEERIILFLHLQRIDLIGWRQELLSSIFHWIFARLPFAPAMSLVAGTEKSCNTLLMGN